MLSGDAQYAQDALTILVPGLLLYRVKAEAGKWEELVCLRIYI